MRPSGSCEAIGVTSFREAIGVTSFDLSNWVSLSRGAKSATPSRGRSTAPSRSLLLRCRCGAHSAPSLVPGCSDGAPCHDVCAFAGAAVHTSRHCAWVGRAARPCAPLFRQPPDQPRPVDPSTPLRPTGHTTRTTLPDAISLPSQRVTTFPGDSFGNTKSGFRNFTGNS